MVKVFNCGEDLSEMARLILEGGVAVFPTDTVYGIGCSPYDERAVERVFSIKGRDRSKSLPVLANSVAAAEKLVALPQEARLLVSMYWPGQLTVIAPLKDSRVSMLVTAGSPNLAVRVPANNCLLALLEKVTCLVGSSANKSGEPPLTDSRQIEQSGLSGLDAILQDTIPPLGIESTIVDFTTGDGRIVREGAISANELRSHLAGLT